MNRSGPRLLVAGGLLALAFAAGAALAPNLVVPAVAGVVNDVAAQIGERHGPGGGDLLSAAADYIGISVTDLRTELQSGKSLADVAVEKGKTRDGLIAALTQAESQRIGQLVDQKGLGAKGVGRGHHVEGRSLAAAATYLGISEQDLRTKLQSGQSLAAIANATAGKSRDGLIAALVADESAKIDAAQTAGKITADQANQMKSRLTEKITALVDATHPAHGTDHAYRFSAP
jgi:hypothetical protein